METICPSLVKLQRLLLSTFRTSYNNAYVGEPSSASRSADSLSLVYVCDSDTLKAKQRISFTKLLDCNDIPAFLAFFCKCQIYFVNLTYVG